MAKNRKEILKSRIAFLRANGCMLLADEMEKEYKSAFVWKKKCTHPKYYRQKWSKEYVTCGICGKQIK